MPTAVHTAWRRDRTRNTQLPNADTIDFFFGLRKGGFVRTLRTPLGCVPDALKFCVSCLLLAGAFFSSVFILTHARSTYTTAVVCFFCLVIISFMSFHCDTCTSAVVFFFVLCSQVLCVMLAVRPALSFQCDTCMHTHKSSMRRHAFFCVSHHL